MTAWLERSALLLVLAVRPAQDEPELSELDQVRLCMNRLGSARLSFEEREAVMDRLLGLGAEGPRRLAVHLQRGCAAAQDRFERESPRLLERFLRAARRLGERRLAEEAKRVEEARQVVLRNARDGGLSEARIRAESDPAVAVLEEILTLEPPDVWDTEPELYESWTELVLALEQAELEHAWWLRARSALEAAPDGAKLVARLAPAPDPRPGLDGLLAEVERRALLATPMPASSVAVFEKNHELAREVDAEEVRGIDRLNRLRVLLGLPAQLLDVRLCNAARGHSQDMARLGFFAHESPVQGKRTFGDRARLAGTSASAENIAVGCATGVDAITMWWYSPGHHRNMLGGQGRTGLGRHERHWTQMFG